MCFVTGRLESFIGVQYYWCSSMLLEYNGKKLTMDVHILLAYKLNNKTQDIL